MSSNDKYKVHEDVLGDGPGRVELLDWMGGDLRTVNAARASYGLESEEYGERESRLVTHLTDNAETMPTRHTYFTLRVKAPEFVARQWYKHVVGSDYSFKDMPWSEFSQRFKTVPLEFYRPKQWRKQHPTDKQASVPFDETDHVSGNAWDADYCLSDAYDTAKMRYGDLMISDGVAREQARIVLPFGVYTEWVWTASLQCLVHLCALRDHPKAQWEFQEYAKVVRELCRPVAPESWDALERNHQIKLKGTIDSLQRALAVEVAENMKLWEENASLKALIELKMKKEEAYE